VDGKEVGDVLNLEGKKASWTLNVYSPVSYEKVELFVNGEVVWTKKSKNSIGEQTYKGSIKIPAGGWVTARVSGGKTEWPMMGSYPFAESSPIWFGEIGSTTPSTKIESANKLLKALNVSEERLRKGYGQIPIPHLLGHFSKAREKLVIMVQEGQK